MKIETEFDINERAFVLWENKVKHIMLDQIQVFVRGNGVLSVSYQSPDINEKNEWIPESKLFKTKEKLLKSL